MFEPPRLAPQTEDVVIARTRQWLERAVIGLNLCPFAKAVYVKNQVHYVVCREAAPADVLEVLQTELLDLQASPAETRDTTLLILPDALSEFLAFNDFLYPADKLLRKLKLSFELIDRPAELAPGFVLSRHASKEDAQAWIDSRADTALKGLRVVQLPATASAWRLRVPKADTVLTDKVLALPAEAMAGGFKPCAAKP